MSGQTDGFSVAYLDSGEGKMGMSQLFDIELDWRGSFVKRKIESISTFCIRTHNILHDFAENLNNVV